MGNVTAGLATQQAIAVWNPSHIVLCGIAGAIRGADRELGDVIVAEQVVSCEPGKQRRTGLDRRYEAHRPAKALLDAARTLRPADWALSIQVRPDGLSDRVIPRVHLGVVGSGAKVIADEAFSDHLRADWVKLIGVEMEPVGLALAAYGAESRPEFLVVKSICDWADPTKEDSWHAYAADTSAAFTRAVLASSTFVRRTPAETAPTRRSTGPAYTGPVEVEFCRPLGDDWEDLADYFEIPPHDRRLFDRGREAQRVWEWLRTRDKLHAVHTALVELNRGDFADKLTIDDRRSFQRQSSPCSTPDSRRTDCFGDRPGLPGSPSSHVMDRGWGRCPGLPDVHACPPAVRRARRATPVSRVVWRTFSWSASDDPDEVASSPDLRTALTLLDACLGGLKRYLVVDEDPLAESASTQPWTTRRGGLDTLWRTRTLMNCWLGLADCATEPEDDSSIVAAVQAQVLDLAKRLGDYTDLKASAQTSEVSLDCGSRSKSEALDVLEELHHQYAALMKGSNTLHKSCKRLLRH